MQNLFINGKISKQQSNYRTTSKHYVDKREVAKQMVKNGFRVFDEKNKKGTSEGHSSHKKRSYTIVTP